MTKWSVSRYRRQEQGWVFLAAMVTLTVLLILGASLIQRAQTALYRTSIDNRGARSFHLAEAGIHEALWDLNQPNGWLTYTGDAATLLGGGFFEVTVAPPPAERDINTNNLTLLAWGWLPGVGGSKRVPRRIHAIVAKDPRYFQYAVFGRDKVTIGNGSVTIKADSYNSDDGGYGGGNVTESAHVGTNSTASDAVEILPQGEVHGDITVGAGVASPEECVSNQGTIVGTIDSADSPLLLPSVRYIPAGAVDLGDVWLDGSQSLVLDEGIYHMTDLDLFGSAQIVCNGKVVIYLDCSTDTATPDIRIGGGGIVNTSGIPSNLIMYCLDDVTNISISGSASFYGAIYAPQADITLNSGEVFGSLIGRTVTMNGATSHVHYDEALYDPTNPHALMCSWHAL